MPQITLGQIDEYYNLCRKVATRLDDQSNTLKKSDKAAANEAFAESVQFECLAAMLASLRDNFQKAKQAKGPDTCA